MVVKWEKRDTGPSSYFKRYYTYTKTQLYQSIVINWKIQRTETLNYYIKQQIKFFLNVTILLASKSIATNN